MRTAGPRESDSPSQAGRAYAGPARLAGGSAQLCTRSLCDRGGFMAGGADDAGDDMVVGRTNESEKRTLLIAIDGDPNGYQDDFVLHV